MYWIIDIVSISINMIIFYNLINKLKQIEQRIIELYSIIIDIERKYNDIITELKQDILNNNDNNEIILKQINENVIKIEKENIEENNVINNLKKLETDSTSSNNSRRNSIFNPFKKKKEKINLINLLKNN